jgi:flagellar basal body rod protein FlgC
MISAINTAVSGYNAAANQIAVNAGNIANAFSTQTLNNGTVSNTPYVPQRVVQSAQVGGGVTSNTQPVNPPSIALNDPGNAAAGADGITQFPNVDQAQQLVQSVVASYNAQASLNVIKVENENMKAVLNIVS